MSRKAAAAGDLENWMKNPRVACHLIPGTDPPVLVDVFKRIPPGDFTFFLSHFHSDHYGGLSKRWSRGVVHCSAVTGRMLCRSLGVDPSYVNHLELDTEYAIGGASVTLVDANHCPGAAMILFRTRDGRVYLHTGDFRFDPQMLQKPILTQRKIDILYLDTTYAAPDYTFVSQSESLRQAVDISKKTPASGTSARTLFLVGAYATGKEKIAFALAEAHGWRIYASGGRRCILDCQDLSSERRALITSNAAEACVHLVPMGTVGSVLPYFRPNFAKIQSYLKEHHLTSIFSNVVGLLPTGWSLTTKWNKEHAVMVSGSAAVHLLEYSEHSSYAELRAFVLGLNPALVVPTVFSSNKNYDTLLEEWQPSKLAAQVALENARQQSTKRKRDGEAVEGDRTQRRITAFFRHKTRAAANVHSEERLASQNKPAASGGGSAGGTQGNETAAAAADALPTAAGGLSAACNGQSREAAARGGEIAESVKVAAATAAVVSEVDLSLETAACTCEQAAGATPEGPAAAGCRPHEHSTEQSSGHITVKPELTSSVAVCTALDFRLKEKQAECSVMTDKGRISTTCVNNKGNSSSTSYHGNGTWSCTSSTSVVGGSSSSSSSRGPNSVKVEQSVCTAVTGNGARMRWRSSIGKGVSTATVSSPLTAKSSHKSGSRLGAIQASRGARACGSDSCSSSTSSIHTLPLSWIQKKGSAAAAGTTKSCKDGSSAKNRQNIVPKTQISLQSACTDSSVAAKGENQEGAWQAVPSEEEVIEISDE